MNLMIIVLIELVRLFFAFDHNNHSKWIRLFFQELETLPKRFRAEFEMGRFVINRSCHRSSSLPIDHAHEQMTKENKGVATILYPLKKTRGHSCRQRVTGS